MSPNAPATASPSQYKGFETIRLSNGLLEAHLAPQIGGRLLQLAIGGFEFLFVNPDLVAATPPAGGLGPKGAWLNWGGEKLWPAPQGWSDEGQWPGPPDAVLDGQGHEAVIDAEGPDIAAVTLTSGDDPRSGIRFARTIELAPGCAGLAVRATMTNVSDRPRRWGIWSNLQHDAAARVGDGWERDLRVYCPMNPKSLHADGYKVMFGLANNLSYRPDRETGLLEVHYQRRVGKVGLDSDAGWVATVNGSGGCALVQRFAFFPGVAYPDNASVEIWLHGTGEHIVAGELCNMPDDPVACPYFIETELLSPYAELQPFESYTFAYRIFATCVGGSVPVVDCTEGGVVCEPLTARRRGGQLELTGRFGVFCPGHAGLIFFDRDGRTLARHLSLWPVTPTEPLVLDHRTELPPLPDDTAAVSLIVPDPAGAPTGLARAELI